MSNKRNRTPSEYIDYGLYLYFLGLSLRNVIKALSYMNIVKRSHVTIWNWIQKFHPKKKSLAERKEVSEYIVDETVLKAGSENIWLWIATEPENGQFLALFFCKNIKREEHVCSRKVSVKHRQRLWKTCCIYRWRYMVSTSL